MKGSCLCGAVRVEVKGAFEHQPEACHCTMCRKQSSSFLTAVNVRTSRLAVHGEDQVGWYSSSDKVKRGFCQTCGSALFWQPVMPDYEWTAVAMGLFDEPTGLHLAKHTFVNEKGDFYELQDDVPQSTDF